jgi:hypothetical protein
MSPSRRRFLESTAVNAAALAVLPSALWAAIPRDLAPPSTVGDWDMSWADKLTGKYRACFDCAEVESGYGVWRASAWANQTADVMKAQPADINTVLVLRHAAIVLAMQQSFWDKYRIGKLKKVTHPLTLEPTNKNPALMDERDGLPAPFSMAGLHKQLARGAIALACNLALQDCIDLIKATDKVSEEAARQKAIAALVPGVILMPSGVFAAVRAQQAGSSYVKSS